MSAPPDLRTGTEGVDRRGALKLFAAGAAALATGCRPQEQMLPYVDMPESGASSDAAFFATALPLAGAARGVLVESHQGKPTKVHGNPDHPASLGGTDVFAEAELLALFDPSRSTSPIAGQAPVTWSAAAQRLRAAAGPGTALLTGPVASPTLARQIGALLDEVPGLRWFTERPAQPALEVQAGPGAMDRMQLWPDWDRTDVVVTLGADPLGPGPGQVALTRGWSRSRRNRRSAARLFAFEPVPTLTGTKADYRMAVRPEDLPGIAEALRAALDGGSDVPAPVARAAEALSAAPGRAVVLPGPDLPIETQALIDEINRTLDAPLARLAPAWRWPSLAQEDAGALTDAIASGEVERLVVLGANPAYTLGEAFEEAARDIEILHFGERRDETAAMAALHGPLHHPLEDWSDLRALDGSAALVQPLIEPLHETRSAHEVVEMLRGRTGTGPRALVQETWRAEWGEDFDARWHEALSRGVIEGFPVGTVSPDWPADTAVSETPDGAFAHVRQLSTSVLSGEYAPNGWLQECPAPLTKQVWGNAASFAPVDAERLGIEEGDTVVLRGGGTFARLPAVILSGQAEGTVGTTLGYGRKAAGAIGSGVGMNTAPLGPRVDVERVDGGAELIRTQREFGQHDRDLLRSVTDAEAGLESEHHQPASFYRERDHDSPSWGMVIDTDVCSGCNACMIACQSENNVPVVGPEEVARGRHMHWIRIDTYDLPGEDRRGFQPVPCMHCEKAPCEPACPVAASVHDEQGLNAQVYNRCVGTRFCQANCPYQVRRFNFFDYSDSQAYADLGADLLQAMRNPDVSVRGRGVMEKCTYCVQRIEAANHAASREDRPIADGEVVTACQSACPAEAITFGDVTDPESAVSRAKENPRHYALLEHLGTRPRTTYLARVAPGAEEDEGA